MDIERGLSQRPDADPADEKVNNPFICLGKYNVSVRQSVGRLVGRLVGQSVLSEHLFLTVSIKKIYEFTKNEQQSLLVWFNLTIFLFFIFIFINGFTRYGDAP